jgi:predicted alpha/beta-hydrolase family hydrolase
MAEPFPVEITPGDSVTARAYAAAAEHRAGITLILGHGAGAGQTSAFMVAFATALADRGIDIVTFNFPYMERGRRIPDQSIRLETCYRAVIETVRTSAHSPAVRLAIGGKSMGGRIASQIAAAGVGELVGLVFLGYPLHPPGRPDRLRAAHLREVRAPMLFVQGAHDSFGTPDELRPIIEEIGPAAELYVVERGDHSFKVVRSAGVRQQDVYRVIQDRVAAWLRAQLSFSAAASAEAAAVATSRG